MGFEVIRWFKTSEDENVCHRCFVADPSVLDLIFKEIDSKSGESRLKEVRVRMNVEAGLGRIFQGCAQ